MSEDPYRTALERLGIRDVRPLYRAMLKRLKSEDPEVYADAVHHFEEEVRPAVEGSDDPLAEWLRYGRWLAGRLAEGRVVAVDGSGRAEELGEEAAVFAAPGAPGMGSREGGDAGDTGDHGSDARTGAGEASAPLLLHLPDDERTPALALAVPARPTEHQQAARELLCG